MFPPRDVASDAEDAPGVPARLKTVPRSEEPRGDEADQPGQREEEHRAEEVRLLAVGAAVALLAAAVPLQALGAAAVLSNLLTFIVVSLLVPVSRRRLGEDSDTFRVPGGLVVPAISICFCLLLILSLPGMAWLAIGLWLLLGAAVYAFRKPRREVAA